MTPRNRYFLKCFGASFVALMCVLVGLVMASWAPDKPLAELTARWAQPPSQFVQVMGLSVHVRDEGPRDDPEPIVLIHGTSASLHTWDGWAHALKPKRRVVRFDLPGFGLTGPWAGPAEAADYSAANYAKFTVAALDALAIPRAVLGGNSLGGWVAWETALLAPERVTRLVLVDAAGYPNKPKNVPLGFRVAATPGLNVLMQKTLPRALVESSLKNVYGEPNKVTPELVDLYVDMTLRSGNRAAIVRRIAQGYSGDAARIQSIWQPTLVIWGGLDRLIPPEQAERFVKDIKGSRLAVFDALGHVPHEEDPAATVAEVQRFLNAP